MRNSKLKTKSWKSKKLRGCSFNSFQVLSDKITQRKSQSSFGDCGHDIKLGFKSVHLQVTFDPGLQKTTNVPSLSTPLLI